MVIGIAPMSSKSARLKFYWVHNAWKANCKMFEMIKARFPSYLRDSNVRHKITGTDETSSAFKVASCREIMELHIFPKCTLNEEEAILTVCKTWAQWWFESLEYVDDHPRWVWWWKTPSWWWSWYVFISNSMWNILQLWSYSSFYILTLLVLGHFCCVLLWWPK